MPDRRSLHRFYCEEPLAPGHQIVLPANVSEQVRRVLRLKVGDMIVLFDGSGTETIACIRSPGPHNVSVEIVEEPVAGNVSTGPAIHLGMALLKSDRFDLVVQKATELGVTSITPLETERCVVSLPADRVASRLERWRRVATEALEQSGRADSVEINRPEALSAVIRELDADRKLIAWERESQTSITDQLDGSESSVAILVGPEGGFTEREVEFAKGSGFDPVSLGNLIFRSETAAIASIVAIQTTVEVLNSVRQQQNAD